MQGIMIVIVSILLFIGRNFYRNSGIISIKSKELEVFYQKHREFQYIDVRTKKEYETHHKKYFKNIPLDQLIMKIDTLDREREIVVICQSGIRSRRAVQILKKYKFSKIYTIQGGMNTVV